VKDIPLSDKPSGEKNPREEARRREQQIVSASLEGKNALIGLQTIPILRSVYSSHEFLIKITGEGKESADEG